MGRWTATTNEWGCHQQNPPYRVGDRTSLIVKLKGRVWSQGSGSMNCLLLENAGYPASPALAQIINIRTRSVQSGGCGIIFFLGCIAELDWLGAGETTPVEMMKLIGIWIVCEHELKRSKQNRTVECMSICRCLHHQLSIVSSDLQGEKDVTVLSTFFYETPIKFDVCCGLMAPARSGFNGFAPSTLSDISLSQTMN